ncbi:hypothetical protein ACFFRR_007252 [Megaselia abdita]
MNSRTNLTNIYIQLRNKLENYYVILDYPPTYLQKIIGNEKIIFVCKKERSLKSSNEFTPRQGSAIKKEVDLDLTGSPLKDDCEVERIDLVPNLPNQPLTKWCFEEELFRGISVNVARSILCDFDLQNLMLESNGQMWILCNGSDKGKTIFLNMIFDKGANAAAGIGKFLGVTPCSSLNASELIKEHRRLTMKLNANDVECSIENYFYVNSNIVLRTSCSSMNSLQLNSFNNCEVKMFQTCSLKEANIDTIDFLNQLRILSMIKNDILQFREQDEGDIKEAIYSCGRGIDLNDLERKILEAFTEFNTPLDESDLDSSDIEGIVQHSKHRISTDLTDTLWDVLKCCSSYKDLKLAFKLVFQCSVKCNIVNIPTNNNRLAEIIREVSQGRLAKPCLSGSEPLELLLEIGLEKLFKDYKDIFSKCNLPAGMVGKFYEDGPIEQEIVSSVSRKSVYVAPKADNMKRKTLLRGGFEDRRDSDFGVFRNSKFNEADVNTKLSKLLQIHLCLEHLIITQINLNVKSVYEEIFVQLIAKPLRSFDSLINDSSDTIECSISINEVINHIENKEPNERKITLKSTGKISEIQSTWLYSKESVFPPETFENISTDDKEFTKEDIYFTWNYTNTKARRF